MSNKSAKLLTFSGFACLFMVYSVYYFSHKRENTRDYIYQKALQYGNDNENRDATQHLMEIADFLLNNMSSHHGNLESTLELYLKYYKAWFVSPKKVSEVVDSIERKDGPLIRYTLEYINDSVAIDKKLLWQYIVDMYEFKNSSVICRKFDNDVFLEYILPYRVGNEPLNLKWKTEAESVLKSIKDSVFLRNNINVPAAANLAMRYWNHLPFKWTFSCPFFDQSTLAQLSTGATVLLPILEN